MAPAPSWDSAQYLRFERERSLPCRDLVARLEFARPPRRIVDLGCGPGTSTAALACRWPDAELLGVDSSGAMLEVARTTLPSAQWVRADLERWEPAQPLDLVLANAVLHWVPHHERAVPRLFGWVAPGGALAFQVPARSDPPPAWVEALAAVRRRAPWTGRPDGDAAAQNVLPLERYYDLLSGPSRALDLWDTVYEHVLPGPGAIVEWLQGAGLRPWLETLADDDERRAFLQEFREEVSRRYPQREGGRVLFPFLRRFVIAYR